MCPISLNPRTTEVYKTAELWHVIQIILNVRVDIIFTTKVTLCPSSKRTPVIVSSPTIVLQTAVCVIMHTFEG